MNFVPPPYTPAAARLFLLAMVWLCVPAALFLGPRRVVPRQQHDEVLHAPERLPELEAWTADAAIPQIAQRELLGALPLLKGQKPAGTCAPPEREKDGGCWLEIGNESPPCNPPPGEQRRMWAESGKCWFPVPKTAKQPPASDSR